MAIHLRARDHDRSTCFPAPTRTHDYDNAFRAAGGPRTRPASRPASAEHATGQPRPTAAGRVPASSRPAGLSRGTAFCRHQSAGAHCRVGFESKDPAPARCARGCARRTAGRTGPASTLFRRWMRHRDRRRARCFHRAAAGCPRAVHPSRVRDARPDSERHSCEVVAQALAWFHLPIRSRRRCLPSARRSGCRRRRWRSRSPPRLTEHQCDVDAAGQSRGP